ncbi:oxygen-evolving enhancer protein 3 [Hibiscus syriacus]|uniref:Oxygen-evolving enhancer protein 3 n=1 Tax=Hibiscus syriacus TaxID=106335 RepID=A0A6A3A0P2_HIBSY|nr:oxygen-evolving enhancer protein 3 [Hibiscus syriacus]
MDKIRRLKKKFENNAGKGKKGEDRSFSKAHEHNAFELSKKIWGKEGISGKVKSSAAKSNGKAKANNKAVVALKAEFHSSPDKKVDIGVPMEVDKVPKSSVSNLFDKRFCVSGLEEELLKHSLDMVDSERKAILEARWRKLQIAELELFIERNELVKEHAKLVFLFDFIYNFLLYIFIILKLFYMPYPCRPLAVPVPCNFKNCRFPSPYPSPYPYPCNIGVVIGGMQKLLYLIEALC